MFKAIALAISMALGGAGLHDGGRYVPGPIPAVEGTAGSFQLEWELRPGIWLFGTVQTVEGEGGTLLSYALEVGTPDGTPLPTDLRVALDGLVFDAEAIMQDAGWLTFIAANPFTLAVQGQIATTGGQYGVGVSYWTVGESDTVYQGVPMHVYGRVGTTLVNIDGQLDNGQFGNVFARIFTRTLTL